jgi:hypothetical protein
MSASSFEALHRHSLEDPAAFWANEASQRISWDKKWTEVS